jgi:uncharacterized zinc-type alcohol dehydrogenase-like protein
MKIQALAVLESGQPLTPFEYEAQLGPSDVLVDLKYCGLSKGDVRFMSNFWGDTKFPLVPGGEMFGTISQVGAEVTNLAIGDYVGIGYQLSSCHQCEYCLAGKEQFCHQQKVLSVNGFGGIAKQIIFDHRFVFKIPNELQKPECVGLLSSGLTVFSGIKRANPQKGMKVGVVGVGNLGHFAIKILVALGCQVTAFTHSPQKIVELKKMGVVKVVDSTSTSEISELKLQYDFIISTSSKSLDWKLYISALKPQGNLMFVGLPENEVSFPAEMLADYAQRGILGSYIGSPSEMRELLEFAQNNNLSASTKTYPLADIVTAISDIRDDRSTFSTVIDLTNWK